MQLIQPFIKLYKSEHRTTMTALLLILLLTIVVFFDTWGSMVSIWIRSETFTHGFFVMPASLWLIWQNKALHPHLHPSKPSFLGLSFVLINGFIWLLASLTHTLVIQQYALVSMLIGGFWFYLGNNVTKKIIFPLLFLYFMVPVGEALLPFLMEYTATFTVGLLRLTGLSVYREGMHFSLVSGDWSVIEACGGLRYLLASITLGVIYAYITYTKTYKRIIFILFSIILPVIANGFRAYMIVMIGHLSGMKLAVGVDHLIYGAVFFGFIIFIMFYIGSFWRDPEKEIVRNTNVEIPPDTYAKKQNGIIILTLLCGLGIWPVSSYQLQAHYHAQTTIPEWSELTQTKQWQEVAAPPPVWNWRPKFNNAARESLRYFEKQGVIIGLYQVNFGDEKQGAELINMQNVLINTENRKKWHFIKRVTQTIVNPDNKKSLTIDVAIMRGMSNDITVAKWYQVGSLSTNNQYLAKLSQLYKRLVQDTSPEIYYVVFTNHSGYEKNSFSAIQEFVLHLF